MSKTRDSDERSFDGRANFPIDDNIECLLDMQVHRLCHPFDQLMLTKLMYRDSIDLVSVWATRADDLLQSLNEHRPMIVHFSGHGSKAGEILVTDDDGKSHPINEKAIKSLFSTLKDNIVVVIL